MSKQLRLTPSAKEDQFLEDVAKCAKSNKKDVLVALIRQAQEESRRVSPIGVAQQIKRFIPPPPLPKPETATDE